MEKTTTTDRDIIGLFFQRDENAIRLLTDKYGKLFLHIALNITGTKEDAEECVNDLYMRLWSIIPPQKPDNLMAFCSRIVRNAALNRQRSLSAVKRGGLTVQSELNEELAVTFGDCDIISSIENDSLSKAIDTFLRTLEKQSRVMFVLRYFYSESIENIAKKTDSSVPKVKSRLMRTRNSLRKYLEKEHSL